MTSPDSPPDNLSDKLLDGPQPELDGRRRRGQDNRARIVSAMMEIIHGGNVAPSAEQVAVRADVGLRTVFRHFQDMDSLYREIGAVVSRRVRSALEGPLSAPDWRGRVLELLARRNEAFEMIAPYKRAADVFRHRSKYLGQDYTAMVSELRRVLLRELPPDILADATRIEALDMLLSFETWSRLRREQALTRDQTRAVLEAAVRPLLQ